jgi:uncharacterized protein
MKSQVAHILVELRSLLQALYRERLSCMVLFGSQARDDADPGSDIDVLVVLRGDVRPGIEIARTGALTAALSLHHNVVISCTFVSESRYWTEQSPLLMNVRHEGVTA